MLQTEWASRSSLPSPSPTKAARPTPYAARAITLKLTSETNWQIISG